MPILATDPTSGRARPSTEPQPGPVHHDHVARAVGATGIAGVALIHFLDVFGKFSGTPYVAVLYLALIAGSIVAARRLIHVGDEIAWLMAGGLAAATLAAYAVSRTVGLPAAVGDIGNWTEPLGIASLFVEGA